MVVLRTPPAPIAVSREEIGKMPYLGESDISRSLSEALTADVEAIFADETSSVSANTAVRNPVSPMFLTSSYH